MGTPDAGRRRLSALMATGCAAGMLGFVLIAVGLIGRSIAGPHSWATVVLAVGASLVVIPVVPMAVSGAVSVRRARTAWDTLRIGVPVAPSVDTLRVIEGARYAALARHPGFPRGLAGQRRIDVPAGVLPIDPPGLPGPPDPSGRSDPSSQRRVDVRGHDRPPIVTYVAANLPKSVLRKRTDPIEPATLYQWLHLDVDLPRLLLSTDFRGQSALIGRDVDIENEDFNRRFRIDSSIPLTRRSGNPAYADFARYASAVLHPRAVECAAQLPRGRMLVIERGIVAAFAPPNLDAAEIGRTAEVLAEFAALLPEHVLRRWASSTDYRPQPG